MIAVGIICGLAVTGLCIAAATYLCGRVLNATMHMQNELVGTALWMGFGFSVGFPLMLGSAALGALTFSFVAGVPFR